MPSLSDFLKYDGEIPLPLIVWSIFIGVSIAILISYFIKVKFGAFIDNLIKSGANSPENALSIEELGFQRSHLIRWGLKMHGNYKNIIVAMTDDGRFYSNDHYTPMEPVFKKYTIIHRIRKKSRIKESENNDSEAEESDNEPKSAMAMRILAEEKHMKFTDEEIEESENHEEKYHKYVELTENLPRQKVNFDVNNAKYYIPEELKERALSIYQTSPTSLLKVILSIIAMAIVASIAPKIIDGLLDYVKDFKDKIAHPKY